MKQIADSGFLIAALDQRDAHHAWARRIMESLAPPWLVCESVVIEVAVGIGTPDPVLEMLRVGDLELAFELKENMAEVRELVRKYRDQPMDLADACVVRMSEIFPGSVVYTIDRSDFSIYRRNSNKLIECEFPDRSGRPR